MNPVQQILKAVCVLLIVSVCPSLYGATAADRSTWQYRKTDLHMTGRGRIRGIRYPRGKGGARAPCFSGKNGSVSPKRPTPIHPLYPRPPSNQPPRHLQGRYPSMLSIRRPSTVSCRGLLSPRATRDRRVTCKRSDGRADGGPDNQLRHRDIRHRRKRPCHGL